MGKVRKNKNKSQRNDPTGLHSEVTEDEEIVSDITPSELSISTAKEQLQAPNIEDKLCGLQTLATLLESKEHAEALVNQSVIRVAAPLLVDESSTVRNSTAGTLRNFSTLGLDACEYLIGQDVMTPLITFFKKYADSWVPKPTNNGELDEDADTFLHSVNLLWNLCESSGTSVKYVNESDILPILTRCLDTTTFGNEMVATVLHCLFVIVEDNTKAADDVKILCEESIGKMLALEGVAPNDLLLRILSAGVIINLHTDIKSLQTDMIFKIMTTLSTTLSVDLRQACHQVSSVLPLANSNTDPEQHKKNIEIKHQVNNLKCLIDAQQTAIEIMTNICSCEEHDDDYMDMDDGSDDECDMEIENNQSCQNNEDSSFNSDKLPIEVIEFITTNELVSKVWAKTLLPAENVLQILDETDDGKHLHKRLCIVQSRSLLCMNNLITNLPIEILGGHEGVYKMWIEAGKLVFKQNSPVENDDILESATSVMRAALERFQDKTIGVCVNNDLFKELSMTDIQLTLDGITQCQCPEIRANLTRMIGTLALILTSKHLINSSTSSVLVAVTEFIVDRIFKETECWVLAEVVDTIMDLFSEDETDELAAQITLVDKLNAILPIFKHKVRTDKKILGDHKAVVSTVLTNLPRFIKYKRNRVSHMKK